MGGVWSDAEGVPPPDWRNRDEQRCKDLVASVYGRFDSARYEQLRAGDAQAVNDLLSKIRATEPASTRDRTVTLFRDVAAAMHEGMLARRAADRVKIDYDADAVETKLSADERTASKALSQHGALDHLLITIDKTAADRRVLGLLLALDREEMARGLPKQLKFYALGHVLTAVFSAAPPPADVLKPTATPRPGTWLAYLSGVAASAGHPVSDSPALTNKLRETLAWTGVGHGFADHLRHEIAGLPSEAVPELSRVATEVATRLETESATAETMSKARGQRGGTK
jgi:muconolactone delta-isomerase